MEEGRQSNVKNSWLGQPQEMMCCWKMFVLKFSRTPAMHKSSSSLRTPRAGVGEEQEQPRGTATKRKASEVHTSKCQLLIILAVPAWHSIAPGLPPPKPLCQPPPLPPFNKAYTTRLSAGRLSSWLWPTVF